MRMAIEERGAGPAVVLVHGLFATGADWDLVARVSAKEPRTVIEPYPRPGLRGGLRGRSGAHHVSLPAHHDGVETRDGGEWADVPGERWARLDATLELDSVRLR